MLLLLAVLTHGLHISCGPRGWVAWIQPPHIAAGFGYVSGHIVHWFEVR